MGKKSRFCKNQRFQLIDKTDLSPSCYHDDGLLLVVFLSQLLSDDLDDDVGLQPVISPDRRRLLLLLLLLYLQRT